MKYIATEAFCTNKNCHLKGQIQPASNFHKRKNSRNGLNNYCKHCVSIQNKEYKRTHKKEIQEYEKNNKEMRRNISFKCHHRQAYYDTYAKQLNVYYEVRRDPKDEQYIQVKCDNCDEWFSPENNHVINRLSSINGIGGKTGGSRLYCSDVCKQQCPVYRQQKYTKFQKKDNNYRELQYQLRTLVLERDEYTCQICGKTDCKLVCHHITGVELNPIESADIDNSITLCEDCDKHVHTLPGCRRIDLRCRK